MNTRLYYEAPCAEQLIIRFEESILSDPTANSTFGDDKAEIDDRSNENWW